MTLSMTKMTSHLSRDLLHSDISLQSDHMRSDLRSPPASSQHTDDNQTGPSGVSQVMPSASPNIQIHRTSPNMQHPPHHRFTTLLITLHGSDTARYEPLGLEVRKARSSAIVTLCQRMIAEGIDPLADAMVMRDNSLCFVPMAVGHWASLRL